MAVLILIVVMLGALILIPLGLPGTWAMVGAALLFNTFRHGAIGTVTIVGTLVLALIGEVLEFSVAAKYTRRYGGSPRAGWGAIVGGFVGALVGVPVPVVGPVIGAFLGAFLGALGAELTVRGDHRAATRVATGALLGRVAAAAMKVSLGVVIAVWIVSAAIVS